MFKKPVIITIILLFITFTITAADISVEYVDGTIEVKQGVTWVNVDVGDSLNIKDTVRVSKDSIAELKKQNTVLTVYQEGTYVLNDLFQKKEKLSGSNINSIISSKIGKILNDNVDTTSASMGVRGDKTAADDSIWMDEEDDLLVEGTRLLDSGDYLKANQYFISIKSTIEKTATPAKIQEFNFYLGYSYVMTGSNSKALNLLLKVENNKQKSYYSDLILIKGKLLIESLSYKEALILFDLYLQGLEEKKNKQAINYLSAICLNELGKPADALLRLDAAVKIAPDTEIGKTAAQWAKQLKTSKTK